MVIYFSGTGNSRFVAERIAEATGESAVNATQYIKEHKTGQFEQSGNYVFVSPVYVSAPPKPFMDFIRTSAFPNQVRAYFVMTCAGGMGGSPEYCRKLSSEKAFPILARRRSSCRRIIWLSSKPRVLKCAVTLLTQLCPELTGSLRLSEIQKNFRTVG